MMKYILKNIISNMFHIQSNLKLILNNRFFCTIRNIDNFKQNFLTLIKQSVSGLNFHNENSIVSLNNKLFTIFLKKAC